MLELLIITLAVSLSVNGILYYLHKKKVKREPTMELLEFMNDISGGDGVIRISRVDPSSIYLRSMKG